MLCAEQQNVQTSLRATIAEVSVSLFFHDDDRNASHDLIDNSEDVSDSYGAAHGSIGMSSIISPHVNGQSLDSYMSCFSSLNIEQSTITEIKSINPAIHHLEARCQTLLFNLQVKFDLSCQQTYLSFNWFLHGLISYS